jgi:hypothetical protein
MRDLKVEAKLKALGYDFKYQAEVPFVEIDIRGASDNPARFGKRIDHERVGGMTVAVRDGAEFPAIVVCRNTVPGLYRNNLGEGSGLHRVLAYQRCGVDRCDAYVVTEPDPERRRMLPTLLNAIEGQTNSATDRYRAIYDAIARKAGNVTDLCVAYAVKRDAYAAWERLERVKQRLGRLGIAAENYSNDQLKEFRDIASDKVLGAVASFARSSKSFAALQELVRDIAACSIQSEEAWLTVVERHVQKIPRPLPGDIKARFKPASEKWCDYLGNALSLWQRENTSVIDGPPDRVNACIEDGLNMLKLLKGEHLRRTNLRKTA